MRAMFSYFGGKSKFGKNVLKHLPQTKEVYVEPYCGSAAVFFMREWTSRIEVLNDINANIMSIYKCVQHPDSFKEFNHKMLYTPTSRAEWVKAYRTYTGVIKPANELVRAWAAYVAQTQSFGGRGGWGCCKIRQSAPIDEYPKRLQKVTLLNSDAIDVIGLYDNKSTVFYLDPPYTMGERIDGTYQNELKTSQHEDLVDVLLGLQGKCVLSGYRNQFYKRLEKEGWKVYDYEYTSPASTLFNNTKLAEKTGRDKVTSLGKRVETLWVKD